MQFDDLISIIIPVYNVESYLEKCLISVCHQTYVNLQIIIVDDGSTDKSGEICDRFSKKDSRIVVIHKTNGGLADARNVGLSIAAGDYIGFVDSDDWIELNMFEKLHSFAISYDLDIVAARFITENEKGGNEFFTKEFQLLSNLDMLKLVVSHGGENLVTVSVWDRLYKKDVIKGLFFPKGKCYEDVSFTTEAFLNSFHCGLYDNGLYHYRIRNDGIMGTGVANKNKFNPNILTDLIPLQENNVSLLYSKNLIELADDYKFEYLSTILVTLLRLYGNRMYYTEFRKLLNIFTTNSKWLRKYVLNHKNINFGAKKVSLVSVHLYIFGVKLKNCLRKITQIYCKKR